MKNPWTTKNPFMSLWLSGANKVANAARGQAAAAAKRETQTAVKEGTRGWLNFWSGAMKAPAAAAPIAGPATAPAARKSPAKTTAKTVTRKSARKSTRKAAVRKAR